MNNIIANIVSITFEYGTFAFWFALLMFIVWATVETFRVVARVINLK